MAKRKNKIIITGLRINQTDYTTLVQKTQKAIRKNLDDVWWENLFLNKNFEIKVNGFILMPFPKDKK